MISNEHHKIQNTKYKIQNTKHCKLHTIKDKLMKTIYLNNTRVYDTDIPELFECFDFWEEEDNKQYKSASYKYDYGFGEKLYKNIKIIIPFYCFIDDDFMIEDVEFIIAKEIYTKRSAEELESLKPYCTCCKCISSNCNFKNTVWKRIPQLYPLSRLLPTDCLNYIAFFLPHVNRFYKDQFEQKCLHTDWNIPLVQRARILLSLSQQYC